MSVKERETVAFRIKKKDKESLDSLAKFYDRDRTYLINKAVENYLEIEAWQISLIENRKNNSEKDFVDHNKVFSDLELKIKNHKK